MLKRRSRESTNEQENMSSSKRAGRFARWREKSFAVPLPILLMLLGLQQMIFLFKSHLGVLPVSLPGDGRGYVLKATVNGYRENDDDAHESFDKEEILVNDFEHDRYYYGIQSNDDGNRNEPIDNDEIKDAFFNSDKTEKSSSSYLAFNETNPYKDTWCPYAICRNSPSCAPCNRRYLFIVANGRSGSTTILRMLNLLPGIRLSGENNGVLHVASLVEETLKNGNNNVLSQHTDITEGSWLHNGIAPGAIACPIQQIISTINPPPHDVQHHVNVTKSKFKSLEEYDQFKILGVKTIRIDNPLLWNAKQAAEFFKRNFPCSKIVVNIRSELKNQVKSRLRADWSINAENRAAFTSSILELEKNVKDSQAFLKEFHRALGPKRSHLLDMKAWKNNVALVNDMVEWLGFEKGCEFQKLLRENRRRYLHDKNTNTGLNVTKCKLRTVVDSGVVVSS